MLENGTQEALKDNVLELWGQRVVCLWCDRCGKETFNELVTYNSVNRWMRVCMGCDHTALEHRNLVDILASDDTRLRRLEDWKRSLCFR